MNDLIKQLRNVIDDDCNICADLAEAVIADVERLTAELKDYRQKRVGEIQRALKAERKSEALTAENTRTLRSIGKATVGLKEALLALQDEGTIPVRCDVWDKYYALIEAIPDVGAEPASTQLTTGGASIAQGVEPRPGDSTQQTATCPHCSKPITECVHDFA